MVTIMLIALFVGAARDPVYPTQARQRQLGSRNLCFDDLAVLYGVDSDWECQPLRYVRTQHHAAARHNRRDGLRKLTRDRLDNRITR
jgi:hypothetical protein